MGSEFVKSSEKLGIMDVGLIVFTSIVSRESTIRILEVDISNKLIVAEFVEVAAPPEIRRSVNSESQRRSGWWISIDTVPNTEVDHSCLVLSPSNLIPQFPHEHLIVARIYPPYLQATIGF
jgi:hypothetical protein